MSDFRAPNKQVETLPGVMPNLEASMARIREANFYGSLLQGYWQCPLAPEAQEIFTIAAPGALPTWVLKEF